MIVDSKLKSGIVDSKLSGIRDSKASTRQTLEAPENPIDLDTGEALPIGSKPDPIAGLKDLKEILGGPIEGAASVATGTVAFPLSRIKMALDVATGTPVQQAKEAADLAAGAATYQPSSEVGKTIAGKTGEFFSELASGGRDDVRRLLKLLGIDEVYTEPIASGVETGLGVAGAVKPFMRKSALSKRPATVEELSELSDIAKPSTKPIEPVVGKIVDSKRPSVIPEEKPIVTDAARGTYDKPLIKQANPEMDLQQLESKQKTVSKGMPGEQWSWSGPGGHEWMVDYLRNKLKYSDEQIREIPYEEAMEILRTEKSAPSPALKPPVTAEPPVSGSQAPPSPVAAIRYEGKTYQGTQGGHISAMSAMPEDVKMRFFNEANPDQFSGWVMSDAPDKLLTKEQAFSKLEPPGGRGGGLMYGQELPTHAGPATGWSLKNTEGPYEVRKFILDTAEKNAGEMIKAKRGTTPTGAKPLEVTEKQAREKLKKIMGGEDPTEIISEFSKKSKNLDVLVRTTEDTLQTIMSQTWDTIKRAAESGEPELITRANQFEAMAAEALANVSGGRSQIGRALRAMAQKKQAYEGAKNIINLLKSKDLPSNLRQKLLDIDPLDTASISAVIRSSRVPKLKHYLYGIFYPSILSATGTHIVNAVSNATWGAFDAKVLGTLNALVDPVVAKIQGRPREYYFREVLPNFSAFKEGLSTGIKDFLKAVSGKEEYTGAAEKMTGEADTSVALYPYTHSPYKAARAVAPVVEFPTRLLIGEDVLAKNIARATHKARLAIRQASKEGLKGNAFENRVSELTANPTEEMLSAMDDYAGEVTFTDQVGPVTRFLSNARSHIPGGRLIVPFMNTLSRITYRGFEMTPGVGALTMFKRGKEGLGLRKGPEVTQLVSKQIVGGAIATYVIMKYMDGEITGQAPRDPAKRKLWETIGIQPGSVKIGGKWINWNRIEPFNSVIAPVVAMADTWRDKGQEPSVDMIEQAFLNAGNAMLDKTYSSNLYDFMSAISGSDQQTRKFGSLAGRTASGFIFPSGALKTTHKVIEAGTTGNVIKRTPTDFKTNIQMVTNPSLVPEKLDLWGEPVKSYEGKPGVMSAFKQLLPWTVKEESKDKVNQELWRLHRLGKFDQYDSFEIGLPGKSLEGIKLSDEQYREYVQLAGRFAKQELDKIVGRPMWGDYSDEQKARIFNEVANGSRAFGKAKMIEKMNKQDPEMFKARLAEGKMLVHPSSYSGLKELLRMRERGNAEQTF